MKHIINPTFTKHRLYFEIALKEALKSEITHKHGCVIKKKNGKILAKGHNRYILTNKKRFKCYKSIHAEVDVINKCRSINLENTILYVVRIGKNGIPRYSKPCSKCQKLLIKKKFHNIYHS